MNERDLWIKLDCLANAAESDGLEYIKLSPTEIREIVKLLRELDEMKPNE